MSSSRMLPGPPRAPPPRQLDITTTYSHAIAQIESAIIEYIIITIQVTIIRHFNIGARYIGYYSSLYDISTRRPAVGQIPTCALQSQFRIRTINNTTIIKYTHIIIIISVNLTITHISNTPIIIIITHNIITLIIIKTGVCHITQTRMIEYKSI